ncbi:DUF4350 domain-containing protein [Quadrisphaera setariae]|uniref:DUF4350 domain-containing protein n=1 Tax=Quadrisphaera setariae TaxID=2593304 RepID=A0A5C8ZJ53_9ACTN|nr:DUF4350 domain-containing protein [Quadrisphaera setariae]TXR58085.1 DUF4350 domain-containing protein [Quadrisphaera setariae]
MTTTQPAAAAPGAVTTTARASGRASGPGRRRLLVALLVVLLVGLPVLGGVLSTRSSGRDLDPDNPAPGGARALAALLEQGGVPVQRVGTAAAASQALGDDDGGATLVVTDPQVLDPAKLTDLVGRSRAVLLLGASPSALEATGSGLRLVGDAAGSTQTTQTTQTTWTGVRSEALAAPAGSQDAPPDDDPVPARCGDGDASAAGTVASEADTARADAYDARRERLEAVSGSGSGSGGPGAQTCFDGLYGVGATAGGSPVRVLTQPALVSNELLDDAGDAALGLRAAGSQPRVVWLVASFLDAAPDAPPSPAQLVPGWVLPLVVQLVLAAVAAVVWRARRFGALVLEPLPVVVRSVETARGRAALYRASRDPAGAGSALRAGLRWRLQQRLGLPAGTAADVLAVGTAHDLRTTGSSAAAGRWTAPAVERLLAGPPPADDAQLAALLRDVDDLEAALAPAASARTPRPARPAQATQADQTPQTPQPSKTPEDLP